MKYLYDTNIFIYYLAEEPALLPFFSELFLSQHEVIISTIVRTKVYPLVCAAPPTTGQVLLYLTRHQAT